MCVGSYIWSWVAFRIGYWLCYGRELRLVFLSLLVFCFRARYGLCIRDWHVGTEEVAYS